MSQKVDQETQVGKSDLYNDDLPSGSTLETGAENLRDDLNSVRTQVKRITHGAESGSWYDDPATAYGVDISLRSLFYSGAGFDVDKILVHRDGTVVVNTTEGNVVRAK